MMEDVQMKENSNEQNFNSCWSNFTSEATLHGVSKLSGSKVRIVCWTLVIVFSFGFLMYNLSTELKNYYSYPVKTQVKVEFHEEMVFPAVTICNLCWRNKSLQDNTSQAQTFYSAISAVPNLFPKINWSDPFYKENGYFDPWTAEEYFSEAMTMTDVLRICWFDGHEFESCDGNFRVLMRGGTLCYTFNQQGIAKTKFSGPEYNLRVFIDIHSDFYTWVKDYGEGIKILVHEPNTMPFIEMRGFRAFPGTATYVEVVKKKFVYQQKPYQAFTNQYCVPNLPYTENSFGSKFKYTFDTCLDACKRMYVEEMCSCDLMRRKGKYPGCSKYDYESCYLPTIAEVSANSSLMSSCGCQHPCESSEYFPSVTYAKFPSDFSLEQFKGIELPRVDKLRTNSIFLHVYYKHLSTETMIQEPVYSNIGDVLGERNSLIQ